MKPLYDFGLISGTAPVGYNWAVSLFVNEKFIRAINFKTKSGMDAAMQGLGLRLGKGGANYLPIK